MSLVDRQKEEAAAPEYELNFRSQMFIVKELWASAVVFLMGYFSLTYFHPDGAMMAAQFLVGTYVVIQIVPVSIIHFQYYRINKLTKLKVNVLDRTMTIVEQGIVYKIRFDQIKSIMLTLNGFLYKGEKRGMLASDRYHYAVIETQGGDKFVITCLLVNDLREFFDNLGFEVTKKKVYYPLVRVGRQPGTSSKAGKWNAL